MRAALEAAPSFMNAAENEGMRNVGARYSRAFQKDRLTKAGGFRINTKGRKAPSPTKKHQPKTAKRFRMAGLAVNLAGQGRGKVKELFVYSRSPLLIQREKGATIKPSSSPALFIPQSGKRAEKTSKRVRRGKNKGAVRGGALRRVRQVRVDASLGFERHWITWASTEAFSILDKAIARGFRRIERTKELGGRLR